MLKKHPNKSADARGEQRATPNNELPDDDLEVTASKKQVVVPSLHPRCGIDRDDADTREELDNVGA